jgi:parallel beta-helix repeat protein
MAIDRIKERYINEMNAMTEAIKLGSELRRMDEGIPAAEKQIAWDNGIANIPSLLKQAKWDSMSRGATLTIAASNATAKSKAAADYVCDGVADEVEINAAIESLDGIGGCVELSEGTFNVAYAIGDLWRFDNIWLKGQGYSTVVCLYYGISIATTAGIAKVSDMSITAGANAIVVEPYSKAHISFCNVYDCGDGGAFGAIYIKGTATVTNCEFADNANYGIQLSSGSANCVITNNRFSNNTLGNISDSGTNNIAENNAEVLV